MQLSGDYTLQDLVQTLQGNFSCKTITKSSKGSALPREKCKTVLELFFVRFEIYSDRVEVYRQDNGTLTKLCTLKGEQDA